jgi:nucleoside 2-deoxyribosyltransferase
MKAKQKVYLAGRMSRDPKDSQWRTDLTPFLEKLGFDVLDPCEFEPRQLRGLKLGRLPEGCSHWTELQHAKEPNLVERFMRYMGHVIKFDLKLIKTEVDFMVVRWSKNCDTGCGTHAEITFAFDLGIPVYCVEESTIPAWGRACCTEMFKNFDELKVFLTEEFGKQS